eukprot:TRINITY_DN4114_c0_g1_i1.p1 TRINITY_DN4114_c0_g1~~TRINITY_DN4114_c0_g1_i1.p1  ORF type:complete len:605 (+),score=169.75 TRINITY_DN4114_c0_g1_i1:111-1925(+)
MREVLTLQFGSFSNFIGSHFWNSQRALSMGLSASGQDEIDPRLLFKFGKTVLDETTFNPRLIIFSAKGSLGNAFSRRGMQHPQTLRGEDPDALDWPSAQSQSIQVSGFPFRLEELQSAKSHIAKHVDEDENEDEDEDGEDEDGEKEKRTGEHYRQDAQHEEPEDARTGTGVEEEEPVHFTDFLSVHLHPKSILEIGEGIASADEFWSFCEGYALHSGDVVDEYEERMHFFLEDCDHLQGVNIFVDSNSAFGGLSQKVMEDLRQETKMPFFVFGSHISRRLMSEPLDEDVRSVAEEEIYDMNVVNRALAMAHLSECSNVFVPFHPQAWCSSPSSLPYFPCLPHLHDPLTKPFGSSAVAALAIDSTLLPFRHSDDTASSSSTAGAGLGAWSYSSMANTLQIRPSTSVAVMNMRFPFEIPREISSPCEYLYSIAPPHRRKGIRSMSLGGNYRSTWDDPYADVVSIRGLGDEADLLPKDLSKCEKIPMEYVRATCMHDLVEASCLALPSHRKRAFYSSTPYFMSETMPRWKLPNKRSSLDPGQLESHGVLTSVESSSVIGEVFGELAESIGDMRSRWVMREGATKLTRDDFDELKERCLVMSETYSDE